MADQAKTLSPEGPLGLANIKTSSFLLYTRLRAERREMAAAALEDRRDRLFPLPDCPPTDGIAFSAVEPFDFTLLYTS